MVKKMMEEGDDRWSLSELRTIIALYATQRTHTIGTNPITATISAKFHHSPAFVFFVIANGIASVHNMVVIALDVLGPRSDNQGLYLTLIAIFDMMIMALASAGDGAAAFMSELGRNGNSHARWAKICHKFGTYCNRGGGALIASFIGIILLLIITVMSITVITT
ncbi:CASP-like protein 1B1 [Lotus japonicus]|uniref:CASP-like protein 1B1 n=1 Tax=Lotus japonicus TaxID=34305 RepID=UPI00258DC7E7|nr:CASP-like protein 1B1 [Lotus japonicus]